MIASSGSSFSNLVQHVQFELALITAIQLVICDCSLQNRTKTQRMATSGRRIGLFSRSGRKVSREEENSVSKTRKISREEMYGGCTLYESAGSAQTESVRKISQTRSAGTNQIHHASNTNTPRQRKISVYSRPDYLDSSRAGDSKEGKRIAGKDWKDLMSDYEPFILGALFFLFISVSLYIVFVEGQSLFGKDKEHH